ncbi:hypothetical protein Moror_1989 [Moniliophthora roreri MCA 2997]|uniref:Uncharacterized protein n=2 Tax=Moniliophthora roreri TaxID=221103 RepID=V2X477_MONRO|nr:hypothetical protein Moror_1989 [Moniliophthora roreri MCA 2997]KAI3597803.1 hypothetical protein WG66_012562 [Moniliophthora roreri]
MSPQTAHIDGLIQEHGQACLEYILMLRNSPSPTEQAKIEWHKLTQENKLAYALFWLSLCVVFSKEEALRKWAADNSS